MLKYVLILLVTYILSFIQDIFISVILTFWLYSRLLVPPTLSGQVLLFQERVSKLPKLVTVARFLDTNLEFTRFIIFVDKEITIIAKENTIIAKEYKNNKYYSHKPNDAITLGQIPPTLPELTKESLFYFLYHLFTSFS